MYYRKNFSGAVESTNVTKIIPYSFGSNSTCTIYVNQNNVINNALKEILTECGCVCVYDEDTALLWIDGFPLSIQVYATSYYRIVLPLTTTALVNVTSTTSTYAFFSGVNYNFYITVKGDPDGILDVYIGTYAAPTAVNTAYSFSIGKGKDLRDNSSIFTLSLARNYGMYVYKRTEEGIEYPEGLTSASSLVFGFAITSNTGLNENGNKIVLVSEIAQTGAFALNQCYLGNAALSNDNFYDIGGSIYYVRDNYNIVKCTNTIQRGGNTNGDA